MKSAFAERRHAGLRIFAMGPARLCVAALALEGALAGFAQARIDAPAPDAVATAPIHLASRAPADSTPPSPATVAFRFEVTSNSPLLDRRDEHPAVEAVTAAIPRLRLPPVSPTVEKPGALAPADIAIGEPEAALAPPMIVGAASMYDPTEPGDRDSGDAETASGEFYDANGWTAAIQIDLRGRFNGVRYRMRYEPTYALVEARGKQVIVRINDVGPLRPGRVIDLNARTMRFFDPSMTAGVLQAVRVTPLPGRNWFVGPVEDEDDATPVAQASLTAN
jgi:rare lipoprotein A